MDISTPKYTVKSFRKYLHNQLSHPRAQGIYNSGGVSDSTSEPVLTAAKSLQVIGSAVTPASVMVHQDTHTANGRHPHC